MTSKIRPMAPGDRQFVVSGWSSSLRTSRDVPLIPMSRWSAIMHPVIEAALERPAVRTLVAHGEVLHGFVCAEPGYVLYIYVAQPFRDRGVARALLEAAGISPEGPFGYACRTRASWELLVIHRKCPLATYDPFRARFDDFDSPERRRSE